MDILAALAIPSLAAGGAAGFATYEPFSRILPRETGVPLGCVFGVIVGLGTAGIVFARMTFGSMPPGVGSGLGRAGACGVGHRLLKA